MLHQDEAVRIILVRAELDLGEIGEKWHSPQSIKAMDACFPPVRWPAEEVVGPDDSVRFVLKDGRKCCTAAAPFRSMTTTGEFTGKYVPRGPWMTTVVGSSRAAHDSLHCQREIERATRSDMRATGSPATAE